MSRINSLLASSNEYENIQKNAQHLSKKWAKSGLLAGLKDESDVATMSMILENQAKQLVTEASQAGGTNYSPTSAGATMRPGIGDQWAGVALPLVRKIFGQIAAKEFVSVQPMNLPSGLVFFLDFQYGTNKDPFKAGDSLYGDKSKNFGNTNTGGLYGEGRFGYSINNANSTAASVVTSASLLDVDFNAQASASLATLKVVAVSASALPYVDLLAVKGFTVSGSGITAADTLQAFTKVTGAVGSEVIKFVTTTAGAGATGVTYTMLPTDQFRGDFEDGAALPNPKNAPHIAIPEINVQMRSEGIIAKTRKLKAVWTPEFAQDLNAYHALDAENELTNIMSEYISLEIDQEILEMIYDAADAGTDYWSAKNNTAWNGTNAFAPLTSGYYNSQGEWFQTLGTKIQKMSNNIHQRTLRGGANFMVVSPQVATIIESIPGFASDSNGDVTKASYGFGPVKMGAINSTLKVYKNPYMTSNVMLLGYKGSQFLETGAVFAPYVPLIMTPLVYDPDSFTPRKGLLTRYAKKMVRPEFYGKIVVEGLDTI